ncbi:MAG TPA: FlgD immunoglobulin-like domain containing protein, partial [Fibrobacteria bacterium]|nr:FlgD immunoglobulin-like domain containing protein [Fibrobacteria bacterium]
QPIQSQSIQPLPGGSGTGTASAWLKLDTSLSGRPWSTLPFREGLHALLVNRDVSPPLIQLSSRGQALLADDYVPRNTPIDVVVRDAEGIDMALRVPEVKSRRQPLDTATLASETSADFPTLARFNFLPKHGVSEDSLEVIATDVSGNSTRRVLAYRLGDDLSVRNLGSYPNPFADTAVFAYTLTDFCEKVTLKVYSRAGRLVRSLEERNVVGYREVVWDGRSQSGGRIGNGLYFLKVTARAKDRESSKVFKLFKKRRK